MQLARVDCLLGGTFYCEGGVDPSATMCPGDDTGLTSAASITYVINGGCTSGRKCEAECPPGYTPTSTGCIGFSCIGIGSTWDHTTLCPGADMGLTTPTWVSYVPHGACDGTKCQFECEEGFGYTPTGCANFACQGSLPPLSKMCEGDDTGVTEPDLQIEAVNFCTARKCEAICDDGYWALLGGDICVQSCETFKTEEECWNACRITPVGCLGFYQNPACPFNQYACQYDSCGTAASCYGAPTNCSRFTSQAVCETVGSCTWSAGACTGTFSCADFATGNFEKCAKICANGECQFTGCFYLPPNSPMCKGSMNYSSYCSWVDCAGQTEANSKTEIYCDQGAVLIYSGPRLYEGTSENRYLFYHKDSYGCYREYSPEDSVKSSYYDPALGADCVVYHLYWRWI